MPIKPLPSIFESRKTVNDRITRYINGKHALLTSAMQQSDPGREETKWAWYSKAHIQTWLEEMDDLGADGMRIYFGEKETAPEDQADASARTAKASGQLCLVMVLTRAGNYDDSHINIVYEDEAGFETRKALYEAKAPADNYKQFNFGSYSPPMAITEGDDYPNDSVT